MSPELSAEKNLGEIRPCQFCSFLTVVLTCRQTVADWAY
jgi:hypothetical protein